MTAVPTTDRVLLDILVVLVAARAAAELAARIGIPSVAAEIAVGILIGPSLLDLVSGDAVIGVLGQLGVILLLLEVGLQLDLRELGAVGRPAVLVAVTGVTAPMLGMFGMGRALGQPWTTALFLGASLAATSVGVSARVFTDLGALRSVEARTVLGAAVADDVIGLVVLAVVAGLVGGGIGVTSVLAVAGLAVGFLVVMVAVGTRVAPPLFSILDDVARTPGTPTVLALAFTLGVAELATAARLAPIVGAFVAGLALGRTDQAERIRRELTPVGYLLIPVFFLQVGIDVRVGTLLHPQALGLAGVLVTVAVAGKLAASLGALGAPGDKLLVGLGMLPRGEVGLIFAALGLRTGVLGEGTYGSLLLAILTTDLLTAPLLRRRLLQVRGTRAAAAEPAALARLLEAAADLRPGNRPPDLEGITLNDGRPLRWDAPARSAFLRLLAEGGERSWLLVAATGALGRALPELAAAERRRAGDVLDLGVDRLARWRLVERVRERGGGLAGREEVLLAAFLLEAAVDAGVARRSLARMGFPRRVAEHVLDLLGQTGVMARAASRAEALDEESVVALAGRLGTPERARALHVLDSARDDLRGGDRRRLDELLELVLAVHEDGGLLAAYRRLAELREEARQLLGEASPAARWLDRAPRVYATRHTAEDLARHAALLQVLRHRRAHATSVVPTGASGWRIEVAHRDRRPAVLGAAAGLGTGGHLLAADLVAWPGGVLVESMLVSGGADPRGAALEAALGRDGDGRLPRPSELSVEIEARGLPWSTRVSLVGLDRPGLLGAIGAALDAASIAVRSARLGVLDQHLRGTLEVASPRGRRLGRTRRQALRDALTGVAGVPPQPPAELEVLEMELDEG